MMKRLLNRGVRSGLPIGASVSSGDYTQQATRVPIPNTTVKLLGPMIVPTSAKVGYRRIPIQTSPLPGRGFLFLCCPVWAVSSPSDAWKSNNDSAFKNRHNRVRKLGSCILRPSDSPLHFPLHPVSTKNSSGGTALSGIVWK